MSTPADIVKLFWRLVGEYFRIKLPRVLDLGAGGGNFAMGGIFDQYIGVEIDPHATPPGRLPPNAEMTTGCVFHHPVDDYDACIGNPPFVRYHDIDRQWRDRIAKRFRNNTGIRLHGHCNLYLYFLCLALSKTHENGLVALLLPFEWVSRPSAAPVRQYISRNRWEVTVFRFALPIFPNVLTTACITIVDKYRSTGAWHFFDIGADHNVRPRQGATGTGRRVLGYERRAAVWARRGISPGSQRIFTLTEGERIHHGLDKGDVVPCVTTLRGLPTTLRQLSRSAFEKHFVQAGRRCWLIRTSDGKPNARLMAYLDGVPHKERQTYTCLNRDPWYAYQRMPDADLVVSSTFVGKGPKVLVNSVGAEAVGVVHGVHADTQISLRRLRDHLASLDFASRVVAYSGKLRKIEVGQLNAILARWLRRERRGG